MNALIRWLASQASSSSAQRPRGSPPERDLVLEPYFDVFADAALLPLHPRRATLLPVAHAAGWSPAWSFVHCPLDASTVFGLSGVARSLRPCPGPDESPVL